VAVSRETLTPGFRVPFGHRHRGQEIYVVLDSEIEQGWWSDRRRATERGISRGSPRPDTVRSGAGSVPLHIERG